MTTLFLVRHPAATWSGHRYAGRTDVPLSAIGRRAVGPVLARLTERAPRLTRVVTSPLRRAAEPAARIASTGRWPLTVDERWREADFGVVEGVTFDDIARDWPEVADHLLRGERAIDWPGGESAVVFRERVGAAWAGILEPGGPATIVVAHAGPIALAISIAVAGDDGATIGHIEPGEIVEIEIEDRDDPAARIVERWRPNRIGAP